MSQYKLYTSGPYKQNNGSAITRTSTDIDLGVAKNIRDAENLNRVDNSTGNPGFPNVKGGVDGVGYADRVAGVQISSLAEASNGLLQLTYGSAHGLSVGNMVFLSETSQYPNVYRVVSVTSPTVLIINADFITGTDALTNIDSYKVDGTFATQGATNFVMMKNDATVHGEANTKLAAGASDYGRRKVAKFDEALNTVRTTTAIRQGKYDQYSGTFDSGFPTSATDTLNTDDTTVDSTTKIGLKGELQYRAGGPNPEQKDYTAKTN